MDIVIVTDARPLAREMRTELVPLLAAFEERGVKARLGAWDNPRFDWQRPGTCVLRPPWNYHRHREAFLHWTRRVPRLFNPPELVAWNSHKSYLRSLEERGIAVVP